MINRCNLLLVYSSYALVDGIFIALLFQSPLKECIYESASLSRNQHIFSLFNLNEVEPKKLNHILTSEDAVLICVVIIKQPIFLNTIFKNQHMHCRNNLMAMASKTDSGDKLQVLPSHHMAKRQARSLSFGQDLVQCSADKGADSR